MIVDSQCHVAPLWYEPIETLLHQMDRYGVDQAVLVQMLGQYDNRYQEACVRAHPDRLLSVVGIDPTQPDAVNQLHRLADNGAHGVRLRPNAVSPGDDAFAIWRAAQARGLAVSCVGNGAGFATPAFAELIEHFAGLTFVLEHLGATSRPDADEREAALRRQVFELARYPNVFLKLPGLGEVVPRTMPLPGDGSPFECGRPHVLDDAFKVFGPQRLMWGSDFPVVASREGYGNALRLTREAFRDESAESLEWMFGGTAQRVFAAGRQS